MKLEDIYVKDIKHFLEMAAIRQIWCMCKVRGINCFEFKISCRTHILYKCILLCTLGTDFSRTISSAAAIIAGMFPSNEDEMWHPENKWYLYEVNDIFQLAIF